MRNSIYLLTILLFSCNSINMDKEMETLKNTDIAFSEYSVQHGMNAAFLKYLDKEAVIIRKNSMPYEGYQAFSKLYKQDDQAYQLSWKPLQAVIAKAADMGYTFGTYDLFLTDKNEHREGTYVSIWKKNLQGEWKVILDIGNEGL